MVGAANELSIAYGCAKAFRECGAGLALTYLNEKAKPYVEPLTKALDAAILMPLDVAKPGELEAVFERIASEWGPHRYPGPRYRLRAEGVSAGKAAQLFC